jgi:hypothetical protein
MRDWKVYRNEMIRQENCCEEGQKEGWKKTKKEEIEVGMVEERKRKQDRKWIKVKEKIKYKR